MRAIRFNHVSICAPDLEESVRFYERVFGMERIPTYSFRFPVQYLRLGEQQLHLFERDADPPLYHHFGIDVDDFEEAYEKARELGIQEEKAFFSHAYELPDGTVQMYIRDPAGNLIEIDWPDVTTLDRSRLPGLKRLEDDVEQTGEARQATLYHTGAPAWSTR
jgi:YD repeat-containing protein